MVRLLILSAFALAFFELPSTASAQKGPGPSAGKSAGQQCHKGPQQAYQPPRPSPSLAYPSVGYPANPVYAPPAPTYNPTTVKAIHESFATLKTVLANLQKERIDTRASRALATDFKTAVQIGDSRSLTHAQKEQRILRIMDQVVANLRSLANDTSLSSTQRTDLAEVVALFREMNQTAQQRSPLSARGGLPAASR